MALQLMKGNEAIVYGALLGGATHYFGYPITPASEIAHAAAKWFPACGRHFLQTECEVASVSMLYGASAAGARTMTGTSGLGLSLMAEQISYLAAGELPCVIVDVQRVGPGLGNIWPEQSDYNCTVKGGGHGSYQVMVLAPNSAQEMCDCAYRAFELAEKWRSPVIILSDGYIGQMMEPVAFPTEIKHAPTQPYAVYQEGMANRHSVVSTIHMDIKTMGAINQKLLDKYKRMQREAVEFEALHTEDADIVFVAFGISSRIAQGAMEILRERGYNIGLFRPKTLFPFPSEQIADLARHRKHLISVELNNGQMVNDIRLAAAGKGEVSLMNWMGGYVPTAEELVERMEAEVLK